MTTTGPVRPDAASAASERVGRPVRRFLLVVVGLALVAVALWWSALVNPRLELDAGASSFDVHDLRGTVEATLTNQAPTSVTIVDVALEGPGVTPTSVATATATATGTGTGTGQPVAGRHLAAGERLDLVLAFSTDGCLPDGAPAGALVVVTTRTPLGIERTDRFPASDAMAVTTCLLR